MIVRLHTFGFYYETIPFKTTIALEFLQSIRSWGRIEFVNLVFSLGGNLTSMDVRINNLTVTFNDHPAIHHLTASIAQGEWLAVVGPNGGGKSTLLNTLAGVITAYQGSIEGLRPDTVAYLPQQTQLDKSFPITVSELVATGLWYELGFMQAVSAEQMKRCENALSAVGLQGFENRLINSLSGGQLQRSLFARVLLQDHPVILLDEPFNAIDSKTLSDLTLVIKQWERKKRTILMVTHDLEYVREHCPKSLLIARECIGLGHTSEVLTKDNLQLARHVSEAFNEHAPWCLD